MQVLPTNGVSMIGLVLVTHGQLATEFRAALEHVVGHQDALEAVSIGPDDDMEERRRDIVAAVERVNDGSGVILLTDMFGGTPSNISLSFLDDFNVEVVTGFNLPMLIKLATLREEKGVGDLAHYICEYGRRNLSCASELVPHGAGE